MSKYMVNSLIVKLLADFNNYLVTSYTYKVLSVLLNWYRHSKINQFIAKYLQRPSSLTYSTTYRISTKGFSSVDRLWDRLSDIAVKCRKGSYVISFLEKIFIGTSSSIAFSLFILFFSCGFGVTSILFGTFNNMKLILLVLGFLTTTVLLVNKSSWIACLKGSLFGRILLYVFD